MKKIYFYLISMFILMPFFSKAQVHVSNPERGFRYEAMAKIPGLDFPWNSNQVLNSQTWCTDLESTFNATDGHIRLSQLYIYLSNYADYDLIDQAGLDAVETLLTGVRNQGYKLVLRFAYTYDGNGGYVYPPMSRILNHLDQLKPIIQDNIDVIHVLQSGIIGLWGEWHNYNNAYSQQDKTNLLKKLVEILPDGRHTMVRLPAYKNDASLTMEEESRIGYYNDFFTDDQHVHSNDWGYLGSANYNQVALEAPSVMVDGEMPYQGSTSTDHLNYNLDPMQCIQQFVDHCYTSFSVAHNYNLNIANWKTVNLTKNQMDQYDFPYDPEYFSAGTRVMYDYISDYLGYRLYVQNDASYITESNDSIYCHVSITNYGFSTFHNPRSAYLVLLDGNNAVVDLEQVNVDVTDWHSGITKELTGTLIKTQGLNNYKLGIWMPDFIGSQTEYDARYAVRLANNTFNWIETSYNSGMLGITELDINSFTTEEEVVGSTPIYCSAKGDENPNDRYIETLNTVGATSDISFSNNAFPSDAYFRYEADKIIVKQGQSFILDVTNSVNTKWSRIICWIDWNRDGVFDETQEEQFYLGNAASDNSALVLNISEDINVPLAASVGQVGMRIRFHDAWLSNPGPCGYDDNTTTFDFVIEVKESTPTYCSATGDENPNDRYIETLSTSGATKDIVFTNNTFPSDAYFSYEEDKIVVEQGQSFTLDITNSANTKWSRIICWIDWNRDGVFDETNEEQFYLGNAASDNSASVLDIIKDINVPQTATIGLVGMRIRFHDAWLSNPGSCGFADNTTTFDFQIEINEDSILKGVSTSFNKELATEDNFIRVFPNPAINTLTVSCTQQISVVGLIDLTGQIQLQTNCSQNDVELNVSSLKPGVYVLKIHLDNGRHHFKKFLKQ